MLQQRVITLFQAKFRRFVNDDGTPNFPTAPDIENNMLRNPARAATFSGAAVFHADNGASGGTVESNSIHNIPGDGTTLVVGVTIEYETTDE